MDLDLLEIEKLLMGYIDIIGKEYPNSRTQDIFNKIKNGHKIVEYNSSSSISFFVIEDKLLLPKYAYNIFHLFEGYDNYGTEPEHRRFTDDYLDTNTTYYDYIDVPIPKQLYSKMQISIGPRATISVDEVKKAIATIIYNDPNKINNVSESYYKKNDLLRQLRKP